MAGGSSPHAGVRAQAGVRGEPGAPEPIGALLTRLRQSRGLSQLKVAERLCAASGASSVSRHEVSRWEREERIPGPFWLGWLAVVLEAPLDQLELAAAVSRGDSARAWREPPDHHRLWHPPRAADLLNELDRASGQDVRELAHAWLAGPPELPPLPIGPAAIRYRPETDQALDALATRLVDLRRMDDLVGGVDLAGLADRELRAAIAALRSIVAAGPRERALRLVAGYAQLAGWVRADAGDQATARRRYRVALRAAAAGGDRPLATHVLGGLSHLSLAGNPHDALLLARTGLAGAGPEASPLTRALLHHRVALAAARAGERRTAHAALTAAEQAAAGSAPDQEPTWLYWLDEPELRAMRGRCLAVLGRPLRAVKLLAEPRRRTGPRTAAVYGGWLARGYLELGEVEQACQVAVHAIRDAVRAGSARAATGLRQLHPLLLRHRDLAAVRGYERLAAASAAYLPALDWRPAADRPRQRQRHAGQASQAARAGQAGVDRPGSGAADSVAM